MKILRIEKDPFAFKAKPVPACGLDPLKMVQFEFTYKPQQEVKK